LYSNFSRFFDIFYDACALVKNSEWKKIKLICLIKIFYFKKKGEQGLPNKFGQPNSKSENSQCCSALGRGVEITELDGDVFSDKQKENASRLLIKIRRPINSSPKPQFSLLNKGD
jgi:hypothetical protein